MRFVFYSNSVSPHQLPLARELIKHLGADNYRYIAKAKLPQKRLDCGWKEVVEPWIEYGEYGKNAKVDDELENCEILLTGERCLELFEKRIARGLKTYYYSERWFKRIQIKICNRWEFSVNGKIRMFHSRFRHMVKRFLTIVHNANESTFRVLPIGVHAWNDMKWLGVSEHMMLPWAYFVEPHQDKTKMPDINQFVTQGMLPPEYPSIELADYGNGCPIDGALRVMYVGRLVKLKHVDTIIKAIREIVYGRVVGMRVPDKIHLLVVGSGEDETRLKRMAKGIPVSFMGAVAIELVRPLMRLNDVIVFASDAGDGWGAVVSEALEENIPVVGTFETGASATMLPSTNLFHVGDYKELARILCGRYRNTGIGKWSVAAAAKVLLEA